MMKNEISDILAKVGLILAILLLFLFMAFLYVDEPRSIRIDTPTRIMVELNKRQVGDCILERYDYGWVCTDKEGRRYVIKKGNDE